MMPLDAFGGVFSACAEVVPHCRTTIFHLGRILRVRGGSSSIHTPLKPLIWYSPRARR